MTETIRFSEPTSPTMMGRLVRSSLAAVLVMAAGCDAVRVNIAGEAMAPVLIDGESALASRTVDPLTRGDIVGFRYPKDESKNFVKRIIGLPGERIESKGGQITVDGQPLAEPYVADGNRSRYYLGPITVPEGHN
jgi:signal peptidase I